MKNLFKLSLVVILAVFAFACSQSTVEPVRNEPTNTVVETSIIDDLQETATNAVSNAKASAAAVACQCVQYVRNRFSALASYRGNAKDWHSNLISAGYKVVTGTPVAGDIIVFQPSFGGGIDATYGHIAVVASYDYSYSTKTKVGTRTLKHRGSNTGGSETECSCNNVKTSSVTYTDSKTGSIAYYHK